MQRTNQQVVEGHWHIWCLGQTHPAYSLHCRPFRGRATNSALSSCTPSGWTLASAAAANPALSEGRAVPCPVALVPVSAVCRPMRLCDSLLLVLDTGETVSLWLRGSSSSCVLAAVEPTFPGLSD